MLRMRSIDEYNPDRGRQPQAVDFAAMEQQQVADGAMTSQDLEKLLLDAQWEPNWRDEADRCADYYDGYQTTSEQERLRQEGQPVAVVNLISRTINTLLGNEARARTSWKLSADNDQDFGDVADALQVKLTEAQRETWADMSISEAYAGQTKAGLGWVEVSRVSDPFAPYPYRVKPVHRNEMWWDWRARELDLSDARWLLRKQWHDLDDLEKQLPEFADVFRYYSGTPWNTGVFAGALRSVERVKTIETLENQRQQFRISGDEWFDSSRKRIMSYEVWYRVYRQIVAMVGPQGPAKEFDPRNPIHAEGVRRGMVKLVKAPKRQLRRAIFFGPHRLDDSLSKQRNFPYVPFWAFREDGDRSPYPMTRGMLYPQDEYNARRSRLMWLLQAAQVIADDDSLSAKYNNLSDLAREIMRPDALIVTNPNRMRENALRVERTTQLPAEQVSVMADAKGLIMEQPGVSSSLMGDKVPGVSSGLAFNSLVTQSNIAIGDHDDNYRFARRAVGERLVDLIVEDCQQPNMQVAVGSGQTQRIVVLNTWDPQRNMPVNMVAAAPVKVALDDIPNTPAYKMQQQQQIGTVLQVAGNDPHARSVLIPAFIESTDLPNRHADAQWLRQQYGVPMPGDRQAQRAADAQRAEASAKQAQMAEAAATLQMAEVESKVIMNRSVANLNDAKAQAALAPLNVPDEMAAVRAALLEAAGAGQTTPQAAPQPGTPQALQQPTPQGVPPPA